MTSRNRSGATTVVAEDAPRWFGIVVTALYGVSVLWPPVLGKYVEKHSYLPPKGVTHLPETAVAVGLAIVAVALIWGCSRGWRMGLYMGHEGVTVRNYFRTYRVGWPEVIGLVDGRALAGGKWWALTVLMDGGRAVTASGTASNIDRDRSEVLTEIRQAAECHGIAADLTGTPGAWRGPKWRSWGLPAMALFILAWLFLAGWFSVRGFHCPHTCGS